MIDDRLTDHAKAILAGETSLTDSDRASLWDLFHSSRDAQELSVRLADVDAPIHVVESLVEAKRHSEPKAPDRKPDATDKIICVLNALKQIDPRALAIAEAHPALAKHFIDAAVEGTKE